MTWQNLVQEKLGLHWLPLQSPQLCPVPFALSSHVGESHIPNTDWRVESLEETAANLWTLMAHNTRGLQVIWNAQFFPDSKAMECWGSVTNRGVEPHTRISAISTVDIAFGASRDLGFPWFRTINGVRHTPISFPPFDFAILDRQLLQQIQASPTTISSSVDGWTSGQNIPLTLFCDERQRHGFAVFLEWAGSWHMQWNVINGAHGTAIPANAAFTFNVSSAGLDLNLQPGKTAPFPRVLVCGFDGGLDAGGNAIRRHIRRHVTPKLNGQEVLPPTSYNHWFAFDNRYNEELLKPAVVACAAAGLEYFCVDGGWYKGDFRDGIGNWSEGDPKKFPNGIKPFTEFVRAQGMKYGTWFEPEWANQNSELYQAHPEWFWQSPPTIGWNSGFHLMNFGLPEVREWWLQRFIRAYEEWGMRWVRWDFNGPPKPCWDYQVPSGEIGWRQIEHVTGLYQTLDTIMEACPDLFIEQCASGGHRIELGLTRRGHSFWMNDHTTNSDIVRFLQQGLNTFLPGNYANTNLCQERFDFTEYDFLSHSMGGFGYAGRIWEAPAEDFERFKNAVSRFKEFRPLLLGDYERTSGEARRYNEYSKVMFHEGDKTLTFEFNLPGEEYSAVCSQSTQAEVSSKDSDSTSS